MVGNNELMLDFINFIYEINKKLWCEAGEGHLETWCDSACWAMKFLSPIMDYYQDVTIEQKKKNFHYSLFETQQTFAELFKFFIW